jgi:type II secretory pathway component PulF
MAQFQYKARTSPTEIVEGVVEAESESSASRLLGEMGRFPLEIRRVRGAGAPRGVLPWVRRPSARHVAEMTRNLSDLLAGGLPLHRALSLLREDERAGPLGEAIAALKDEVQAGAQLSAALGRRPDLFDDFYLSMVRAGEVSGRLAEVLRKLADFIDEEQEVSSKVRAAMTYPAIVLSVGAATVVVLLAFVVPRLTAMFEDLNQLLPLPTRMLVGLGDFMSSYGLAIVAALAVSAVIVRAGGAEGAAARWWDAVKLRVPVAKSLMLEAELGRYSRTLSALLRNGVHMVQSLDVAAGTSRNAWLRAKLAAVGDGVKGGERLGDAFRRTGIFPPLVRGIVAAGEESGNLDTALDRAAALLERNAELRRRTLLSLLEPGLILATGLVVAFIVFAMMLPVFYIDLTIR